MGNVLEAKVLGRIINYRIIDLPPAEKTIQPAKSIFTKVHRRTRQVAKQVTK